MIVLWWQVFLKLFLVPWYFCQFLVQQGGKAFIQSQTDTLMSARGTGMLETAIQQIAASRCRKRHPIMRIIIFMSTVITVSYAGLKIRHRDEPNMPTEKDQHSTNCERN